MLNSPTDISPRLCAVLSYSLLNPLRTRAEFHPVDCREDFPLGWLEQKSRRLLVAARSSSVVPPHTVNCLAIARELRRMGCTHIVSSSLCRALDPDIATPSLMIPDQFIDMHRVMTSGLPEEGPGFQDFAIPWCERLRSHAYAHLSRELHTPVRAKGCYVGVDGPRYETAAEARAYRILGADVVGMTAVREAIAYRQAGLCSATIALVTNPQADEPSLPGFADVFLDCAHHVAEQIPSTGCDCSQRKRAIN